MNSKKQMLQLLEDSSEGFANSLKDESVLVKLAVYGFNKERLTKDVELNQEAAKYLPN
jgi:hypothetical protein